MAMVATQCCWKLGDTAELQPSLWHGLFSPSSPSKIHVLLLLSDSSPNRLQHSWEGAPLRSSETGAVNAAKGGEACGRGRWSLEDWPWSTLVMWLRRSVKNSGTPSYPVNTWRVELGNRPFKTCSYHLTEVFLLSNGNHKEHTEWEQCIYRALHKYPPFTCRLYHYN